MKADLKKAKDTTKMAGMSPTPMRGRSFMMRVLFRKKGFPNTSANSAMVPAEFPTIAYEGGATGNEGNKE
jgi:hypothetical protein